MDEGTGSQCFPADLHLKALRMFPDEFMARGSPSLFCFLDTEVLLTTFCLTALPETPIKPRASKLSMLKKAPSCLSLAQPHSFVPL